MEGRAGGTGRALSVDRFAPDSVRLRAASRVGAGRQALKPSSAVGPKPTGSLAETAYQNMA